jgi:hypothetical protein
MSAKASRHSAVSVGSASAIRCSMVGGMAWLIQVLNIGRRTRHVLFFYDLKMAFESIKLK